MRRVCERERDNVAVRGVPDDSEVPEGEVGVEVLLLLVVLLLVEDV